ncbi:hypothetical protein Hanom_Chr05g00408821 [Helianthus anomalus]
MKETEIQSLQQKLNALFSTLDNLTIVLMLLKARRRPLLMKMIRMIIMRLMKVMPLTIWMILR